MVGYINLKKSPHLQKKSKSQKSQKSRKNLKKNLWVSKNGSSSKVLVLIRGAVEPCGAGVVECCGVLLSVVECCWVCWLVTSTLKSHLNPKKVTSSPKKKSKSQKSRKNLKKFMCLKKRSNPPLATSTPVRGPIILSHKVKYHGAIAWCNQTRVQGLLLYMFQLYFHYLISTFSEPCYNSSTARARHHPCAPPPPPESAHRNSNICQ